MAGAPAGKVANALYSYVDFVTGLHTYLQYDRQLMTILTRNSLRMPILGSLGLFCSVEVGDL